MTDFYSKAVMTVIALALSAIAWNLTFQQPFISPAVAEIDSGDIRRLRSDLVRGLEDIEDAIKGIAACSR